MRYYLDISDSITSALKTDYDEDDDRRYSYSESDTSLIVAMFERWFFYIKIYEGINKKLVTTLIYN